MKKKILISGANGFIGSNLISSLLDDDKYEIHALSRAPAGNHSKNIKFYYCDFNDPLFIKYLPEEIDCIVHLAQSPHYREFPTRSTDIFNVNVHATQQLLDWARRTGVKKFLYASSGNVYSRKADKLKESDICEPNDFYSTTKFVGELLTRQYEKYFEVVIMRIFGVFGPGQNGMLIPQIIQKIFNGEEIQLAKAKGLFFSPLYIDDIVRMIFLLIESKAKHQVYNISGEEVASLDVVVNNVIEILNLKARIKITNDEVKYLISNNELFKEEFNFQYTENLYTGLRKTLDHSVRL